MPTEEEDARYYQEHRDDPEEWGEPVYVEPRRPRLESMLSVRLSAEEADLVRSAASAAGQSVSDFIRAAILQRVSQAPSIQWQRGGEAAPEAGNTPEGADVSITGGKLVGQP
jgi:hypothetical protein